MVDVPSLFCMQHSLLGSMSVLKRVNFVSIDFAQIKFRILFDFLFDSLRRGQEICILWINNKIEKK